ncbi:nitric-oxide reductase large subunit [Natrinema ejinorense]|uniref:Nitric-oxide reductase n=1 Tax=Natrinema ejinorense TaxID=373386 RepID=A0A2A5QPL2_9EURY|nr:cbb3-type cytochrome c oxidase subunit I [Natrinema ejinorense]PCR88762.1 nitric-oxide reductase [Natrinema ejinorense]
MDLTNVLSERLPTGGTDRERPTDHLTDRLETATERNTEFSRRVRTSAGERIAGVLGRGGNERRSWRELGDRLVERAATELCDRVSDRRLDERGKPADLESAVDDPLARGLDSFLRRYDLDETRLDDETLSAIRDRIAAETSPDEVFQRLVADGLEEASAASNSDTGSPLEKGIAADHALADACSHLCAELDVETDQPLESVVGDLLQRDAVVVGHAIERTLRAELPQLLGEQSVDAAGIEDQSRRRGDRSRDATEIGAAQGADRPATALALAATIFLSDAVAGDRSLARLLPISPTLTDGGSETTLLERALLEACSSPLLETGGGVDLDALRSESTGSVALVALFVANLVAMGLGAWISHERAPPIPDEIRGPDGEAIVTAEHVQLGKKAFQANGLMNLGSILGNGSYFGVDLTADALALKAEFMREYYARQRGADTFEGLADDERAAVAERVERELDADAPDGSVARYSAAEVHAHRRIRDRYVDRYHDGAPERGIPSGFVGSADHAERIADFACWTAWMAHTNRPGSDHSYTNDWPYVPATGNRRPTGQVLVWSTISVVLLIAGGGAGVWAYHSFDFAEPTTELVDVPAPDAVSITPTQYAAAWYVPVAGALFVAQTLVGALLAHYYVERTGFYRIGDALGIDVVSLLPFSVGRAWHVNLGILWITLLWLAGGLFLPGLFSDRDPPWQAAGTTALLAVLVLATVGAFAGVWLGTRGKLGSPEDGDRWWWFGSEGLEYLEVGRFWKLGLLGAFAGWTGLVLRGVRQLDEPATGLGHFMTYAGGSIALMFAASMLYTPETNMAVTEFWRWWVVHMWVEGVFEFFVTAVISAALVSMELIEKGDAETAILFEVFAIMAAGIVGVSHHYWWVGLPDFWVPLGTTFSTLEFVPLVFVLYRSLGEYRSLRAQGESFPYTLPLLFILGSSVWNFVGGGVLGFFINLPVINYYEHGTYLTVAHAHTSLFGAFGLLALGLGAYILRVVTPEAAWDPAWFRGAFWLTNVGLVIMTVASLLPVGFAQLRTAYRDGYDAARSLEFYERDRIQTLLWARTLGDTPMILGALAFTVGAVRHLYAARRHVRTDR